jgi:hypothetical protein
MINLKPETMWAGMKKPIDPRLAALVCLAAAIFDNRVADIHA